MIDVQPEVAAKNYYESLNKHTKLEPHLVSGRMPRDFRLEVRYTRSTWPGGVPVTKRFRRNPPVYFDLLQGWPIYGVHFSGAETGVLVFDFVYGDTWYSAKGRQAQELLDLLGVDL